MNLKGIKIFRLIFFLLALIGWILVFIFMALYNYELLKINRSMLWGFIIMFSAFPLFIALFDYTFFNIIIREFQKNIKNYRRSQKYCYSCGIEIVDFKTLKECPECNANLDFLKFLPKI
jgi:hypothetical protein